MSLVIYNSLTRQKEEFKPMVPNQVKMYCCGPTVYDLLHVGNFRGAIFYNFMRHWLEHLGYKVTFVYNYTDVDDKIIRRANEEKVSSESVADRYVKEFEKDFKALGLKAHDHNPRVTQFMDSIIQIIETLIAKEKAYVVDGEVLYSISSFAEYGKLSGRQPDELLAGARVEIDQRKRNPLDFALWKPSKEGEPSWESPWGRGRPGWHIECSAMVRSLLGDQIDIHGGGTDLIFPHHENEIAQSEGCTGHPLARYWVHNNMFTFSGQKMSKSLGNIWRGRDFMEEYNPEIFKYLVLSVHYRSLAEFSEGTAELSIRALARIYSSMSLAESLLEEKGEVAPAPDYEAKLSQQWTRIETAINDDFGTPEAFATLFEVVREFNQQYRRGMKLNPKARRSIELFLEFIRRFGKFLSLFQQEPHGFLRALDDKLLAKKNLQREHIDELVQRRQQVRAEKDFARADELRAELTALGIQVADTPQGSFWEVQK